MMLLRLQRTAGNAAVCRLLGRASVRVGAGDPLSLQRAVLDYGQENLARKDCGAYMWIVQWTLKDAEPTTEGYIVQEVKYAEKSWRCNQTPKTDKPEVTSGKYYEAWKVNKGEISQPDEDGWLREPSPDRRAIDLTVGSARFMENEVEPDSWKPGGVKEAGRLLSSTQAPANWKDTGNLDRSAKVIVVCCGGEDVVDRLFLNGEEVKS